MMTRWLVVFLFAFACSNLLAQDYPRKDINPANLADEVFAIQDLDINYQDLYENYLQLISNPFDLNKVTEEQLHSLYILSQDQITAILKYRLEGGSFISVYELQTILDRQTFLKVVPFVTVPDATQSFNRNIIKRIASEQNNYLLLRWGRTAEPQQGYSEKATPSNRYTGSVDNFYARFRTSRAGDFSLGFTMKKDAGEVISWNPSKGYYGFDYLSFHIQTQNKGKIKNLIVGDYQAQFGQGITLGSVFGIGKNGEAVNTMRRPNLGFTPYTSIYEAGFFRGAALSYSLSKNISLHSMASARGRDGALQQDTISSSEYLSSISYTGLHRTANELANRNAITESNAASVLQFKKNSLDAGLIFHHTQFSSSLLHTQSPYNQFVFNGTS
ncbi:MAG TPA: helix-hairpin-helix domain-containing protein, partial [Cyclobacteriaceae bacterium]|nr:helix-hairpin-helix domain-containing protein [Cyclobacteriaceae bacterium]